MAKETEKAAWGGAFDAFGKMALRAVANPEPGVLLIAAYLVLVLLEPRVVGAYTGLETILKVAAIESVFYLIFLLAIPTYGFALARGKALSIREFLRFDAKKYYALLVAGVLYPLAIAGSLLLLIFPAIWVIAWFALYQMAIVDKGMGPVQALKESKRLIRNHKGKVWGVIGATVLLSIGISLLRFVPFIGIVLNTAAAFALTLLNVAVFASLYRWAKAESQS